jgi:hypothetical protein
MVLSTLIWRYVPFGSSNFEGDEEFRYNWAAVNRRRASRYADEPEEFRTCTRRNKRTGETWEVDC